MGVYFVLKSVVFCLIEIMVDELRVKKINVNSIMFFIIDMSNNCNVMFDVDYSVWVKLEDLVNVVGFLVFDVSSVIYGVGIFVVGLV